MMIGFLSIAVGRLSGAAICIGGDVASRDDDWVAFPREISLYFPI